MKNKLFTECFSCYNGYECQPQKLPRKKKKQLSIFFNYCFDYFYMYYMEYPSKCNISSDYKRFKKLFPLINLIKKNKHEIDFIRNKHKQGEIEEIFINDEGRLSWYWETDDDYGGSSGLMPFCYNQEAAKKTWAYSEVSNIIEHLLDYPENFKFPSEIISDKTLLKFIKKQLKNNNENNN